MKRLVLFIFCTLICVSCLNVPERFTVFKEFDYLDLNNYYIIEHYQRPGFFHGCVKDTLYSWYNPFCNDGTLFLDKNEGGEILIDYSYVSSDFLSKARLLCYLHKFIESRDKDIKICAIIKSAKGDVIISCHVRSFLAKPRAYCLAITSWSPIDNPEFFNVNFPIDLKNEYQHAIEYIKIEDGLYYREMKENF